MTTKPLVRLLRTLAVVTLCGAAAAQDAGPRGWLNWRGPQQNGTSLETGLPDKVRVDSPGSWSYQLRGRGTPVVADGRVYCMGYAGEGKELQERVVCLDEKTGALIWEHRFSDFVSDVIYHRYGIGSPTIDPDTGDVFCISTPGLVTSFTRDGEVRWQHSMMTEYGRLTFPNGRTGAALIDGDLCIVHVITSNWGRHSPARDRFHAFDKRSGVSVWSCTPGGPPKDSSFSMPVVATESGRRVLYAGLGGGHLVAVDVRTGDPIWRFQMCTGGVNSSALLYKDSIIAIHGKENLDTSTIGRMVSLKRVIDAPPGTPNVVRDAGSSENWRQDLVAFTSSPVLVGNRVYQTVFTGDLFCVNADTGEKMWHKKLAPDQIHASPAWADGKLYVPMNNGTLHVIRPTDAGPEVLSETQLEGNCLGAPAIANGRIYVHTTERLYSFAGGKGGALPGRRAPRVGASDGVGTRLRVLPADIALKQGDRVPLRVQVLDALGLIVNDDIRTLKWTIPDGVGVAISDGELKVARHARPSAFIAKVASTNGGLTGSARIRVVPAVPFMDDFNDVSLKGGPDGTPAAPGRPYWAGGGKKWDVRMLDGEKVLAKTISNPLFQRSMSFVGHPDSSNYTMTVDIRTDGNRRMMSSAGLVNQRYLIALKGNHQQLEISSNMELLKETVRFRWKSKTWYRMKTRVDVQEDGSAVVRAKVWKRADLEPEAWTLEVRHPNAHTHGAPGIWGFAPQTRFRVYLDNLKVTTNE